MSKKNFSGGLNALLEPSLPQPIPKKKQKQEIDSEDLQKKGRPRTNLKETRRASQEGTLPGETRATFIVNEEKLEQIKAVAFWERATIKDVVDNAINLYLAKKGDKYLAQALEEFKRKK